MEYVRGLNDLNRKLQEKMKAHSDTSTRLAKLLDAVADGEDFITTKAGLDPTTEERVGFMRKLFYWRSSF